MQRSDIFNIIKENIVDIVEDLPEDHEIQESDGWRELRADSLDVVMVVSDTMKQLNIKLDRTELHSAETLHDLLDFFERAVAAEHGQVS